MRFVCLARSTLLAVVVWAGIARADDMGSTGDEDLPDVHTISCDGPCADFVDAVHLNQQLPKYPQRFTYSSTDGSVLLQYMVTPEGKVGDIATIEIIGPSEFVDVTKDAIRNWTFEPATVNGKPVATSKTFRLDFGSRADGARPSIAEAYQKAFRSISAEKWKNAAAILSRAQSEPELNFYERAMLGQLAARLSIKNGDYFEARRLLKLATDHEVPNIDTKIIPNLFEMRIVASLHLGDLVDALWALVWLKRIKGYDATTIERMVADARAKADSLQAFATAGKIPPVNHGDGYMVGLYRRAFAFKDVSGSLEKFTLSCKQQAIESHITETAEWHVPKSWSNCWLVVRGAPDSTFKLVQMNE